ncbi:PaaI family thioesterase [Helicobacter cappadocius]|uniref:PaaI family thioesterase n=1 Tax=Helicobacter cappadocius TaxID=3063998 RepID=A0AA90PPJ2_9HELI|nr:MULTISPECIES: PaaI family thioesterase [unclassified Helicobacter]MDO7252434.1 PaaI family thioesterase [Helicobacter sp. faydin-H75]MDP2538301.1 PaaI family thioesterase [Helicobacter sp. faydin-H76]
MDEQIAETEQNATNAAQERIVCNKIDTSLCGELTSLSKNSAQSVFIPKESMISDENMIHNGFVFNAASYAALCAINRKNSIIIGSEVKFFAPIELGHEIIFQANAIQSESKKTEVKVEGFLLDIKIFDGTFYVVIFDKKLFKLRLKDKNQDA